ncbi:MAG: peptidoglycan-binding protein [Terriglobales bacterium]
MSLVIGCSLAWAGIAMAQQPEASPSPAENKKQGGGKPAAEAKHGRAPQAEPDQHAAQSATQPPMNPKQERGQKHAAPTEATVPNQSAAGATPAPTPGGRKGNQKHEAQQSTVPAAQGENPSAQPGSSVVPAMTPQAQGRGKGAKDRADKAKARPSPSSTAAAAAATATPKASATPAASATAAATATPTISATATASASPGKAATTSSAAPQTNATATPFASPSASPAGAAAALPTPKPNTAAATKKPAPQQVQEIKSQNASFRAQPRPQEVPAVTYNPQYRIQGADQWRAPQYEVFRSYRPERHDEGWYHSHYSRVEQIGGGWYYWNNGYWYPAWGYRPHEEYYAYDGPIYVGRRAERADQVIADVQVELKHMGYYKGEVDGLVGPLTREALREYQDDSGLYQTSVIDEPTLESLGLAS